MPCAGKGPVPSVIFIEEVLHEAGSWPSLCSESPIKMTVFRIVTGRQKSRLPWPKATSQKESRSPCSKPWKVWLRTMQPT